MNTKLPKRKTLWKPRNSPRGDLKHSEVLPTDFNPATRGVEFKQTENTEFDIFVEAVMNDIMECNRCLRLCKIAQSDTALETAERAYRKATEDYEETIEDYQKYKTIEGEIFIDPVINNGYVVDVCIIADMNIPHASKGKASTSIKGKSSTSRTDPSPADDGLGGVADEHSSSYVSLYPGPDCP